MVGDHLMPPPSLMADIEAALGAAMDGATAQSGATAADVGAVQADVVVDVEGEEIVDDDGTVKPVYDPAGDTNFSY